MKNCDNNDRHKNLAEHYAAADIDEKLTVNIRGLGHTLRFMHEGKGCQRRILSILNEDGATTQRELTARLGIQPGSASEVISKLENAGLIVRGQNADDRRTVDISLTEEGRRQAAEIIGQKARRREEMFSCLDNDEKRELLSLLEKLHTDWKRRYNCGCSHGRGEQQE